MRITQSRTQQFAKKQKQETKFVLANPSSRTYKYQINQSRTPLHVRITRQKHSHEPSNTIKIQKQKPQCVHLRTQAIATVKEILVRANSSPLQNKKSSHDYFVTNQKKNEHKLQQLYKKYKCVQTFLHFHTKKIIIFILSRNQNKKK